MHEYEDEEAYELRLARRQWLDPERKEKIMGKLKELVFNYDLMNAQQIFGVINQCNLLGFGHADYSATRRYGYDRLRTFIACPRPCNCYIFVDSKSAYT